MNKNFEKSKFDVVGVGVPDDPCPLPASKNRPGNDTHPTNSISVYSVLPFKNASAGMVA